ncbi:MAG: UDP-2,3-diacylglucosamine diphosphatase [Planctomycetaceae bacterium]|nr:MAG: UDP-2,3-diacylglucosamine diphosphatase [Planctomycetaceae bacterium]
MDNAEKSPVRTLLISDVHLGCKHSQSSEFLQFLRGYAPDRLYIVGDFIDAWKISSGWHWSDECDQIIAHLVRLAHAGTRIFYVPGNHDCLFRNPAFRDMLPRGFPHFEVANEFVFETVRGWKLLVTHGDLFDIFETRLQWISKASTPFYDACLSLNWWFHRWILGEQKNPYGVCAVLKNRVKRGVRFISQFESKIKQHARQRACEGVVCGHIHTPDIVQSDSMLYFNTGDWVENCTGLVEHHDGRLELTSRYSQHRQLDLEDRRDTNKVLEVFASQDEDLSCQTELTATRDITDFVA